MNVSHTYCEERKSQKDFNADLAQTTAMNVVVNENGPSSPWQMNVMRNIYKDYPFKFDNDGSRIILTITPKK